MNLNAQEKNTADPRGKMTPWIEGAWKTEVDRRIAEIQAGKVRGIPADESLARIRKLIGR